MTTLLPEDVPGATLRNGVSLENHSLSELKRWLECRELEQTGTKNELILRIQNSIETGDDGKIDQALDEERWYNAKMNDNQPHQPITSKFSWDNVTWGTFPSCYVPKYFNKGRVYAYMLGILAGHEEVQTFNSVKPFRKGHQHVSSDLLSDVEDGQYKQVYACKCKCSSVFQTTRKYEVGVTIHKISGAIINGTCQCKQTPVGKCSHIKALLLFIWDSVKGVYESDTEADASEPCEWGSRKHQRNTSRRVEGTESAVKKYKPIMRDTFDPRPAGYTRKPGCFQKLIADLQKCDGNSLFETLFPKSTAD